ncbi:MAG: hypothetical protein PUC15_07130 [Lentisphaeria bacterium]|nr:hypothetical protein [Lentisphaeria bacterium]
MSTKRAKTNADEMNWPALILTIIILVIIELLGNYCNKHHEEHRQKEWERFERRMQEVHYMTKWD